MEDNMIKAIERLDIEEIKEILASGFDVNKQYFTPKFLPTLRNKLNCMEYLFEIIHGKKQPTDPETGLPIARTQGAKCVEIAKLFMMAKGFDYTYTDTRLHYGYLDMAMEILTNNLSSPSRNVADVFTQYGISIIVDLMKHFEKKGGDLVKFINRQHKEGDGMSPFHRIIYIGIYHDLRCFGTGHGYNKFTYGENTRIGYYDLVNYFIESGADIGQPVLQDPKRKITPYVEGLYPIHLAARICNGVIPITDADGSPEYQGVLNLLVAHDVDIFKKSLPSQHVYNKTALHFACDPYFDWFNDYSIEATAYHKINPSAYPRSQGGDAVMRHRVEYAEENVKFLLEIQEDILKAALTKGEELESNNLNAVDSENYTPLMVASREIMFPANVYKLLLDGETYTLGEPTALDIYDNTYEYNTALFLLLLNLPIKNEHEKSTDIISQSDNRLKKIYRLLARGANTALKNKDGMTPLDIAIKQQAENAIASLVSPEDMLEDGRYAFQAAKVTERNLVSNIKIYSIDETSLVYPELPKSTSIQTISSDHVISDPITLEEKTIKEILDDPVDNLIFAMKGWKLLVMLQDKSLYEHSVLMTQVTVVQLNISVLVKSHLVHLMKVILKKIYLMLILLKLDYPVQLQVR